LQEPIQKWAGRMDEKPAADASISAMDQAIFKDALIMLIFCRSS